MNILFYAILKSRQHLNLGWCCQGFFLQSATVFFNLCYNDLCNMSVFFFSFIILIDDHLSSLSSAFSLPSPLRVDILVFVFFVSFMSSLVSRIIAFFPCDVLLVLIDSDCPSILNRNFQAKIQVLCDCVYASVCFSFPVFCFI